MKKHQSIRLFKNPILESFTHVHPSIPFILWIPIVLYFIFQGLTQTSLSIAANLLMIIAGLFVWTLTEYTMHRHVFHFDAKNKVAKYLVFLFHGNHHDDPQDPTRLVMPPIVSITLSIPFYYFFRFLVGREAGFSLFAGFMIGYMIYDYIHFATHHFTPRTKFGKFTKENHMKHHFIPKGAKWGVSTPLWDHVFKTFN